MLELQGKYTDAKIHAETVEQEVISQVYDLLNHPMFKDETVRIMADTHAGKGCVIGMTPTTRNIIIPNIIGVDINCGMLSINLESLDNFITTKIPNGRNTNSKIQGINLSQTLLDEIKRISKITNSSYDRHLLSIGSLGGGNHFIEVSVDKDNNKWLIIHSGSRNFGLQVAKYHQKVAEDYCRDVVKSLMNVKNKTLGLFQQQRKDMSSKLVVDYIETVNDNINKYKVNKDLSFLENDLAENYIKDMKVASKFAHYSRESMADRIVKFLNVKPVDKFETVHNYYDGEIIRKGAISAKLGEKVLIPINMKDGSILAIGKGNSDYNYSAPHGAGRLMSRSKAKATLDLDEFKESMNEVYSTSVCKSTLDEAPQSYKSIDEILNNINETVDVIDILKPIYNFKSH